jgi:O-antigen ligase
MPTGNWPRPSVSSSAVQRRRDADNRSVESSPRPFDRRPSDWAPISGTLARQLAIRKGLPGSSIAFGSLLAFTFVLFVAPQQFIEIPAPGKFTAGLAIASHVLVQISRGAPLWRKGRPIALAAALFGWAVMTTPFSLWPGGSAQVLFDQYLKSMAAFWLVGSVVDRPRRLLLLLWALCFMSLPITLTAIGSYASLNGVARIRGYGSAMASNVNELALVGNLLVPVAAGLMAGSTRTVARWILLAIIVLNAGAIVLTFSRSGFLALICNLGLCTKAFVPKGKRAWALVGAGAFAVAVALYVPDYTARLNTIWNVEADSTGSAQERSRGNLNALTLIVRKPLMGNGVGQDVLAMNEFEAKWVSVHNVYLQHAVDLGVPGLVLFVWLFISCMRCLGEGRRTLASVPSAARLSRAADGVRISLLGFMVSGLFGPLAYHYYFYYPAGLALAVEHVASTLPPGGIPGPTGIPARWSVNPG